MKFSINQVSKYLTLYEASTSAHINQSAAFEVIRPKWRFQQLDIQHDIDIDHQNLPTDDIDELIFLRL